jgi:exopolysaccharide biosynthesis polyprenyl glycosylphosphotransferase
VTSRKKSSLFILFSIVIGDAACIFAGLWLAYVVRFHCGLPLLFGEEPPPAQHYTEFFPVVVIVMLLVYRAFGLYRRHWSLLSTSELLQITKATILGKVTIIVFMFMFKNAFFYSRQVGVEFKYSTGVALLSIPLVTILVALFRRTFIRFEAWYFRRAGLAKRLVCIGTTDQALTIAKKIAARPELCYDVIGLVSEHADEDRRQIDGIPVLGTLENASDILVQRATDEVILCLPNLDHETKARLIVQCEKEYIDFRLVPDIYEILASNVELVTIAGVPLVGIRSLPLDSAWNRLLKRSIDLIGSTIGLIVLAIPMLIIALLVKRSSPGPALYKQVRCGEDGRQFVMYKFRTMVPDAERQTGPVWAERDDPRKTPIGKWLRRYNLDELPQLLNVFKGDMSLVGPRPERPYFIEQFKELIPRYFSRHHVKCGITGWAQVNGLRQNTSIEERIKHDVYYIENWSVLFDLRILVRTLFTKKHGY